MVQRPFLAEKPFSSRFQHLSECRLVDEYLFEYFALNKWETVKGNFLILRIIKVFDHDEQPVCIACNRARSLLSI
jgi:hypothetical protein